MPQSVVFHFVNGGVSCSLCIFSENKPASGEGETSKGELDKPNLVPGISLLPGLPELSSTVLHQSYHLSGNWFTASRLV